MTCIKPRIPLTLFLLLSSALPSFAGIIFQNFEPGNATPPVLNSVGGAAVSVVDRTEAVHLGVQAVKAYGVANWTGFGVQSQISGTSIDLKQTNNDRLTFWTYALPQRNCNIGGCSPGTENNVGVTFYDQSNYRTQGFEVWTTQTARYGQWSKLKVLFSQLPPNFDLTHVVRIEFKNYWPGNYYFDDIHAVREDRVYQAFEKEERNGSTDGDYGWKWNSNDTVAISGAGEPAYAGNHSWKLISTAQWGGTGLQSQEQRYFNNNGTVEQTFWHVDLDPANNDRLTFWVYGQPINGMDNNIAVQFYDNGNHFTDATKVQVWTKSAAVAGRWTRLTVLFSDVLKQASDFDFRDINKIQLQCYWPGTYYFDEIRATGPQSQILESSFAKNFLEWKPVKGAGNYRLQESMSGPQGPWKTIYSGRQVRYKYTRLSKTWLRVRWEEAFSGPNSLPYASGWSDLVEYLPPAVVLTYANLRQGVLKWTAIPQTQTYEVQTAPAKAGPWTVLYQGTPPVLPVRAQRSQWYRIRGIQNTGTTLTDFTAWSRPQRYAPGRNFVRANGTVLKEDLGTGDTLVLAGVNLGGGLVVEPWMTGLGNGDTPALPDDWNIRERLGARFGVNEAESIMRVYERAYVNTFDFDRLVDQGVTLVRLPVYYRNFQDDNGNWIKEPYSVLDQIINALSDRGIYVLIDMHGAPGLQSADATTGRAEFNQLFATGGGFYRTRTEDLWRDIAKRYRENSWVLGYDLLNEPLGVGSDFQLLANVYDQLYRAIRSVDTNHLIVMEGIWYTPPGGSEIVDWDTLPPPQHRNWTNVMYQYHFYHWEDIDSGGNKVKADENFPSHKAFIDQKLAAAAIKQAQYNVPVMIGEFYGFNLKSIWEYYLDSFNSQEWSWTSWSLKYHDSPSSWGIVAHSGYDEPLPNFQTDAQADLLRKLSKYATADYHTPTVTLTDILEAKSYAAQGIPAPIPTPIPQNPVPAPVLITYPGKLFSLMGQNLGDTPGTFQFYPAPCNDFPPGSIACNLGDAGISFWSPTLVNGTIPPDAADLSGRFTIRSQDGGELYPTMIQP